MSLTAVVEGVLGLDKLSQESVGNELLRGLSGDDYALLQPALYRMPMNNGDKLATFGSPIDQVCFPEGGIAGFLEVLDSGGRVAVGLLGREGFAGWPALMGNDRWPHEVVARGPDTTAVAIQAAQLGAALEASATLRLALLRYASSFINQITATLTSNLTQSVEQRTARWLLMYHDRIDGDEFTVTHDELGVMLGVRRASITDALHQLEGVGGIRSMRGRVVIRDRQELISLSGDTYGRAESEYERLICSAAKRYSHE